MDANAYRMGEEDGLADARNGFAMYVGDQADADYLAGYEAGQTAARIEATERP